MNIKNLKWHSILSYSILLLILGCLTVLFVKDAKINEFVESIEYKTFDLRQSVLSPRPANKDIVLVTIDDASFEYLLGKYGEWPIQRSVYANLINYLEKQNPKVIAFDLMFIKSLKSKNNDDLALINSIRANNNVYVAMNFDKLPEDVRKPVDLPSNLSVNLDNNSKINLKKLQSFENCRPILAGILNSTSNVGIINITKNEDGMLREISPFISYKDKFYPYLAMKVGLKYLGYDENKFVIDKNANVILGDRKIPIYKDGGAILNWYGPAGRTFEEIPLYKLVKAMDGDKSFEYNFKDKIVYIGTTAVSLSDTKSVPVGKIYPGVEVHATFVNNMIDNNFIKRVNLFTEIIISLFLAVLVGCLVFRTASTFVTLSAMIILATGYTIFTYYVMKFFNIWLPVVLPVSSVILIFMIAYIIKYVLKSRDFEHQYKLATTDGLTELYNHRYFQEQILQQIANCKRYDNKFSMIIIDIDFFKKFNDSFGHQSGDAVLKQVAQKLKKNVRATDIVCRYGGEEMTIILPNTDKEEATITAQKICDIVAQKPFKLANNQESNVTISLGVATFPEDGVTAQQIIEYADNCLYYAKENGRNQVGKVPKN